MTTRIRTATAFAGVLTVIAGLTACATAEPTAWPESMPSEIVAAPEPVGSAAGSSPCGTGGVHGDEDISSYVTHALGAQVVDSWVGVIGKTAIICIEVTGDVESVQRGIDAEFGEGQAYVVSSFPKAAYTVTTRSRTTVIDDGERPPQLCSFVQESLPPRCEGVDLAGWDWESVAGSFKERDDVRWGVYAVTGTYSFDTDELSVESATTDDPDAGIGGERPTGECPDGSGRTPEELRAIYDQVATGFLEFELGIHSYWWGDDGCGALAIGVAFDDGRLQEALDDEYGEGATIVDPLLHSTE